MICVRISLYHTYYTTLLFQFEVFLDKRKKFFVVKC